MHGLYLQSQYRVVMLLPTVWQFQNHFHNYACCCCLRMADLFLRLFLSTVTAEDLPVVETIVKSIIKQKQPFERLEVSVKDLLEMFKVTFHLILLQM